MKQSTPQPASQQIDPLLYTNLVQQFLMSMNPLTLLSGDLKKSWQAVAQYTNNRNALKEQHQQEVAKLARIQDAIRTTSGPSDIGNRINRLR